MTNRQCHAIICAILMAGAQGTMSAGDAIESADEIMELTGTKDGLAKRGRTSEHEEEST
jgi:hypothetical protein